jgi:hypothetical protein
VAGADADEEAGSRAWSPIAYVLVGAGQLTFTLDDAVNGNFGVGLLFNLARRWRALPWSKW